MRPARLGDGRGARVLAEISRGGQLVILLAGGDKQSQARDTQAACDLARSL